MALRSKGPSRLFGGLMRRYKWQLVALVVCAALAFVWLVKAPIFGSFLTRAMRVPVSVVWVGFWPHQTNLHAFKIKNPRGFKDWAAFRAGRITCDYQVRQLFGKETIIDQIAIQTIVLRVDFADPVGTRNNWTAIAEGMPPARSHRRVFIRKLVLHDFNVEVHGMNPQIKIKQNHFDRLEFDDIDS